MTYDVAETRQALLDTIAEAIDELAVALAALGAAYEQLDEHNADLLEAELFRPIQTAYGRAQRTHAAFAERYGLPGRTFQQAIEGAPSTGAQGFVEVAVEAADVRRPAARRPAGLAGADRGRRPGAARRPLRGPHADLRRPRAGRPASCRRSAADGYGQASVIVALACSVLPFTVVVTSSVYLPLR